MLPSPARLTILSSPHQNGHDTTSLPPGSLPFTYEEIPQRFELLERAVLQAYPGSAAPVEDFGLEPILAVHDPGMVEFLRTAFERNAQARRQPVPVFPETFAVRQTRRQTADIPGQAGYYCFEVAAPLLAGTWQAAYWSAQTALTGAERLHRGGRLVYALCRPPGHHASRDLYGGFCYLNNAAIAARRLGEKTAILDIDFHHGNGTQEIFYEDPGVLFCSLHADPDLKYPFFWGGKDETGAGAGSGYNHNWPLPLGIGDEAYLAALDEAIQAIQQFDPRWLVVSLGLDIAENDPLGGFTITPSGLKRIGRRIAGLNLPTLVVQEGGYLIERLADNALAFFDGLTGGDE